MAVNQNPFQGPDIHRVKVEKEWPDKWWVKSILSIFVAVIGGIFLHEIYSLHRETVRENKVKPPIVKKVEPALDEKTPQQTPPQIQNDLVDVIPAKDERSANHWTKDPTAKVHSGQIVPVKCEPAWVPTNVGCGSDFCPINLWIESVVFDQSSTALNVAVSPWSDRRTEPVSLLSANGAYLTDDRGFRYDLLKDGGSYVGNVRGVNPDEIYRFVLVFGKMRPTEKLLFHHHQFQPIIVWLPWSQTKHKPLNGTRPNPCGENGGIAVLKNGSTLRYTRRETNGSNTRLFNGTGYADVATEAIESLEKCVD
jgi:hypothetical protein